MLETFQCHLFLRKEKRYRERWYDVEANKLTTFLCVKAFADTIEGGGYQANCFVICYLSTLENILTIPSGAYFLKVRPILWSFRSPYH